MCCGSLLILENVSGFDINCLNFVFVVLLGFSVFTFRIAVVALMISLALPKYFGSIEV